MNCIGVTFLKLLVSIALKSHVSTHMMKQEWIQKLSEYWPNMKLLNKCHTKCLCHPPFHLSTHSPYWQVTPKYEDCLVLLTYPHIPDEARMSNHQASCLVSICLVFVFYTSLPKIMIICYTVPEIWHVTDVIVIFHFGLFFVLLPR